MRSYAVVILRDSITGFRINGSNRSGEVNGLALSLYLAAGSFSFLRMCFLLMRIAPWGRLLLLISGLMVIRQAEIDDAERERTSNFSTLW